MNYQSNNYEHNSNNCFQKNNSKNKKICIYSGIIVILLLIAGASLYGILTRNDKQNFAWILNEDGRLTITGKAKLALEEGENAPWNDSDIAVNEIYIGSDIREIDIAVFEGEYYLKEINVDENNKWYASKDGVLFNKDLSKLLFYCHSNEAESYDIPDTVTGIGERAFSFNDNLKVISIPETVEEIGENAIAGCSNLSEIQVDSGNQHFVVKDGALYDYSLTKLILYPAGRNGEKFSIAENVEELEEYAFYQCKNLTSVEIPEKTTSIGDHAFGSCENLESIKIPETMISIGERAFASCEKIESIEIPENVEKIGSGVLVGCNNLSEINVNKGNENFISEDGILYNHDKSVLLQYPVGNKKEEFVVPYGVKTIGDAAFGECANLHKITLPDDLEEIGEDAFSSCSALKEINIPGTVSKIGDWAFYQCINLQRINLSDGIKAIGAYAFYCCDKLETIYFSKELEEIGESSFGFCGALKTVTFPDSLRSIGQKAFYSCEVLEAVHIPVNVDTIGSEVFYNCENLSEISVDEKNQYYYSDQGILYNKKEKKLITCPSNFKETDYVMPSDVEEICDNAFKNNANLESIIISEGVKTIGNNVFDGCYSLQSVTAPESLEIIGDQAFLFCRALKNISLPESVRSIGNGCFLDCDSLEEINIDQENKYYASVDGVLFNKKMTRLLCYPANKKGDNYVISSEIKKIDDFAFANCNYLESATIPSGITKIGKGTFNFCDKITEINIPETVTEIEEDAFSYCTSLESITIPDSVTKIGAEAFSSCYALSDISISENMTEIGEGAFRSCSNLTEINVDLNNEQYSSEDGILFNKEKTKLLQYPARRFDLDGFYEIPEGITEISAYAFSSCELSNISIPEGVTEISGFTFMNCSNLLQISVPDSVTKIEDYAIFDCSEFYRLNISGDAPGLGEMELFVDDSEDIMICVPKDAKGYEKEPWNAYKVSYDFNENQIENVSAVSESEFHSLNLTGALTEQDFLYMEKGVVNDALEYVNTGTIIYLYYEEGQYPDKKSVVETARGICIGDSREKVFDAYGENYLRDFNEEDPLYLGGEMSHTAMLEECKSYVAYGYNNAAAGIFILFDENDCVSWVVYYVA